MEKFEVTITTIIKKKYVVEAPDRSAAETQGTGASDR